MASRIAQFLCSLGWHTTAADGVTDAIKKLGRHRYDFCILDGELPDNGSIRLSALVRSMWKEAHIIVFGTARNQEKLQSLDADATLNTPINDTDLLNILDAVRDQRRDQNSRQTTKPCSVSNTPKFFGNSSAMREVSRVIEKIAPTTATVLISGESGTGKSLLAREIHRRSNRSDNSLVEVACGSLTESLLESELFGHSAGAFTGATTSRDGMFTRADRGTIFLDEIATATPAMQVKLLRVLQDFNFEPVGGSETKQVDARVILATHENLEDLVCSGKFREDLFWRINVITIQLPPLRERRADIRSLAEQFLSSVSSRTGRTVDGFTPAAIECLETHHWPGNVRELVHAVERAAFLGSGKHIDVTDFPLAVIEGASRLGSTHSKSGSKNTVGDSLKAQLASPERRLILDALRQHNWRRDAAAKALGINRATLYKKAKRLGVDLAQIGRTGTTSG
jgi:DNA-binding NtrC family response regulator